MTGVTAILIGVGEYHKWHQVAWKMSKIHQIQILRELIPWMSTHLFQTWYEYPIGGEVEINDPKYESLLTPRKLPFVKK